MADKELELLKKQESNFIKQGGIRENMYQARKNYKAKN